MTKNKLFIMLTILILFSFCQLTEAAAQQLIKIGVYSWESNQPNTSSPGEAGCNLDYLQQIAAYNNWKCQFVYTPNLKTALNALAKGEVDLVSPVTLKPELTRQFTYTSLPLGTSYEILVTNNYSSLNYEDFEQFGNIKIGYLKPDFKNEEFFTYAKQHNFQPDLLSFYRLAELRKALDNGRVQAIIINALNMKKTDRILGELGPTPFYCLVQKNNLLLKKQLDDAIAQIKINSPIQENYIFNKYYKMIKAKPYSKKELDFIKNCPPIRIACMSDTRPVSYLDGKKHLKGITIDILKYIEKESGLTFNYLIMPQGKIPHNFIQTGQTDFVAGVLWSPNRINNTHFILTNPYLESNLVMVQKKGRTFSADLNLKIAIPENFIMAVQYVESNYPEFSIQKYATTEECLKAVIKDKADLAIQNTLIIEELLSHSKYRKLALIPQTGSKEFFSLMGSSITDPLLVSILNKAISHIPENYINQSIINNTAAQKKQMTFNYFIEEYGKKIFFIICILSLVIAILFYALEQRKENLRLVKTNKQILNTLVDLTEQKRVLEEITAEKELYQLTIRSSKDIIFDLDFANQKTMFSNKFAKKFGWKIKEWESAEQLLEKQSVHPEDIKAITDLQSDILNKQLPNASLRIRIKKADDSYLWCEVNMALLYKENKLVRIIGKIVDIDSQVKKYNELEALSQKDDLTGLFNKKTFQSKIEDILKADSYNNYALIFMDLDNFKLINDTLGHLKGDECLTQTADKLRLIFNEDNNLIARFGGDEFCVFLHDIEKSLLEKKAVNIAQLMHCSYADDEDPDKQVELSASIGIYCSSRHDLSFADILDNGDKALYEAKNTGKNNIIFKYDE